MESPAILAKRVVKFGKEVLQEGKRIVWPTRRDVGFTCALVIVLSFVFAVFFSLVDAILGQGVHWILTMGGS